MENRIDSENRILEIRAEEVQLPKPDFLRRYKEEDIRQYLQDVAGLHRQGSGAVTHYTMLELADRFKLMNLAFDQEDYRVDKNLEVIPMPKKKDS